MVTCSCNYIVCRNYEKSRVMPNYIINHNHLYQCQSLHAKTLQTRNLSLHAFDNEIAMKIPMGYKAILAYERLDIVSSGNIVWRNQDRNAWERRTLGGRKINYFDNSVTPVIDRYLDDIYCIFDQQGKKEYGAYCGFIDSYERAMTKAISLSKECNEKFLVCKVLAWQDWH